MAYFEMTRLVLKWALTKPPTTRYPFEARRVTPGSRGQVVFHRETCVFCTVCAKKCPTYALTVHRGEKKWGIDRLRCISCGACTEVCPKSCLSLDTAHGKPLITRDREYY